MMQPGRETNYPTSSGTVAAPGGINLGPVHIGMGMLLLLVAAFLLWYWFGRKGRRR